MTLSSDLAEPHNINGAQFSKFLQFLEKLLAILEDFEGNYDKKLNLTLLLQKVFNVPHTYAKELAKLLLKTQDIFDNVFKDHQLKEKKENDKTYLITNKKIPSKLIFTPAQIQLFNDLIYAFRHIKKGNGFDLARNGTKLSSNLKLLKSEHPYLFEKKENGLIYPSSFGMKLGDLIMSYGRTGKEITKFSIDGYTIQVKKNE